jgi:hypothetical protein
MMAKTILVKTVRRQIALSIAFAMISVLFSPAAHAQEMLSLYQRHRALGKIDVFITKNAAKITLESGHSFVIAGPSWDVKIINPKRKLIAITPYETFKNSGPKTIEYFEGATDWPLVLERSSTNYKGVTAKIYGLPFKQKNGKLVDLKRGKAGSYYVLKDFIVDPHVLVFFQQMYHLQAADGVPLKYVKIGRPFEFGQGLAYNRHEGVVTTLDTITTKGKPLNKEIFDIPRGYKKTSEGDVTLGDKTEDMREIIEQLD